MRAPNPEDDRKWFDQVPTNQAQPPAYDGARRASQVPSNMLAPYPYPAELNSTPHPEAGVPLNEPTSQEIAGSGLGPQLGQGFVPPPAPSATVRPSDIMFDGANNPTAPLPGSFQPPFFPARRPILPAQQPVFPDQPPVFPAPPPFPGSQPPISRSQSHAQLTPRGSYSSTAALHHQPVQQVIQQATRHVQGATAPPPMGQHFAHVPAQAPLQAHVDASGSQSQREAIPQEIYDMAEAIKDLPHHGKYNGNPCPSRAQLKNASDGEFTTNGILETGFQTNTNGQQERVSRLMRYERDDRLLNAWWWEVLCDR
jgi:hypothetical protein